MNRLVILHSWEPLAMDLNAIPSPSPYTCATPRGAVGVGCAGGDYLAQDVVDGNHVHRVVDLELGRVERSLVACGLGSRLCLLLWGP